LAREKNKRKRDDLKRRVAFCEPKPRILVVCEGEVTEPHYLKNFSDDQRNGLVEVDAIGLGYDPKSLVEESARRRDSAAKKAEELQDEFLKYDDVWCVFDIDDKPKERKVSEARKTAKELKVKLGISNPSFELWAIFHFQDYNKPGNQNQVRKELRKHLPKYNKELPYEKMSPNYVKAVERAKASVRNRAAEGDPEGDPSTTVFKLTETIKKFGKK